MVILAFLVNLLDTWLPRGKHLITWFLWRCTTVVFAILAHWAVTGLISSFLPDVIVEYAPTILLGLLVLMLAVGALKFVVGAALAVVNPIIGALYTFFFANIIGKEISKAMLSTALLTTLIWALNEFGVTAFSISAAALMAYLPFLVILAVVWLCGGDLTVMTMVLVAYGAALGLNTTVIPAAYGKDTKPGAAMAMISHAGAVISLPLMYALLTHLLKG